MSNDFGIRVFRKILGKRQTLTNIRQIPIESPKQVQTRQEFAFFGKKFWPYIVLSILYGLIFINYIDILFSGYGYHIWLTVMYFFPFIALFITFPKNWQLVVGLGLISSLMNDLFYGTVKYAIGMSVDLSKYFSLWLIPQGDLLFSLNLGFTVLPVYSWMMALSIYARIILVVGLLWIWRRHARFNYF